MLSGFYATTWVSDGHVNITIEQRNDKYQNGEFNSQQLRSHINGKLGEWLAIGALADTDRQSTTSLNSRQRGKSASASQLYMKIDLID